MSSPPINISRKRKARAWSFSFFVIPAKHWAISSVDVWIILVSVHKVKFVICCVYNLLPIFFIWVCAIVHHRVETMHVRPMVLSRFWYLFKFSSTFLAIYNIVFVGFVINSIGLFAFVTMSFLRCIRRPSFFGKIVQFRKQLFYMFKIFVHTFFKMRYWGLDKRAILRYLRCSEWPRPSAP